MHARLGGAVLLVMVAAACDLPRDPEGTLERRVRALGLRPTDLVLETSAHVVVVVPGENAFRVAIERYMFDRRTEMPGLLEEAVA